MGHGDWTRKLREGARPMELSPRIRCSNWPTRQDRHQGIVAGTQHHRGHTQWIIGHAHQMGLVTYGEFVSTPYQVGIEAGVDALLHMSRYELGVIPDELQRPLVDDPEGPPATTAYDYSERLPATDSQRSQLCSLHCSAPCGVDAHIQPLLLEPAGPSQSLERTCASLLDPARMFDPPDRATGERVYPLPVWTRHFTGHVDALDGRSLPQEG